jgi:hypothetical protein
MRKKNKNKPPEIPTSGEIETFSHPSYQLGQLAWHNKPSAFNGVVTIRKYKVRYELIDEPIEVLRERVQKLWNECDNHHEWTPLKIAAAKLGMELNFETRRKIS